eukprot:Hpha_TRINITY_DN16690_c0_g2::TRINITY_DN16690_c0_g2_i2::g.183548::m.183548
MGNCLSCCCSPRFRRSLPPPEEDTELCDALLHRDAHGRFPAATSALRHCSISRRDSATDGVVDNDTPAFITPHPHANESAACMTPDADAGDALPPPKEEHLVQTTLANDAADSNPPEEESVETQAHLGGGDTPGFNVGELQVFARLPE